MAKLSNHLSILIMPTDICNMDCIYCFHNSHHEKTGKMSLDTLRQLYDITFKEYEQVSFIWHGGEPLCMGLPFYEKAIEMQKKYPNVRIINRMQSNLTLLNDEIADFLVQNNIGIGTSMDGVLNDKLRGNTQKIIENRKLLLSKGQNCGFIMVVSGKNIDSLISSYEMYKELKANFNMNPYVSVGGINDEQLRLDPEHTTERLVEFYEYWKNDAECNIEVSYFERIIKYILYGEKSVCKNNSCLGKWLGVRYNGDVVPCNRYFPQEYGYGNVWDYDKISDAFDSEGFKTLLIKAIERRKKCKSCKVFSYCSGGCNNVALNENGIENNNGNCCKILVATYVHIFNDMLVLRQSVNSGGVVNPRLKRLLVKAKTN